MRKLVFIGLLVYWFIGLFCAGLARAQTVSGFAVSLPVTGSPADGTLVCSDMANVNSPCAREYDPMMTGVVVLAPAVQLGDDTTGQIPIVSSGQTGVLVSSVNGVIKKGDYITSSKTVGIAQKATKSGYILGMALEGWSETDINKTGKIAVAVSIKPAILTKGAGNNLMELVKEGFEGAFQSPLSAFRYIIAGVLVIASFIIAFTHFGRVARSGIEAIGRNPLAGGMIKVGIYLNVGIMALIVLASLAVAYFILVI